MAVCFHPSVSHILTIGWYSSCTIGQNGTLLLQGGSAWENENEGKSEKSLASNEIVDFADQDQNDNHICTLGDENSSCDDDYDGG